MAWFGAVGSRRRQDVGQASVAGRGWPKIYVDRPIDEPRKPSPSSEMVMEWHNEDRATKIASGEGRGRWRRSGVGVSHRGGVGKGGGMGRGDGKGGMGGMGSVRDETRGVVALVLIIERSVCGRAGF